MRSLFAPFFTFCLFIIGLPTITHAQTADELVKQGIVLNDSGKYDQAIEKYKQAMKADPYFENAYYEAGYTLFSSGKEDEALPYLEKLIAIDPKSAGGYDMIGSIYDDKQQSEKAEIYFKQGIDADSTYQRLHYNLGILYYRQKRYAESEKCAIKAIKLMPTHASSQRLFAMTTFEEHKRGASLLAWCDFLLIEPQSKRSPNAIAYIKYILNYGITRKDAKNINISTDVSDPTNMLMQLAIVNATEKLKGQSEADTLQAQLTEVFKVAHGVADDKAVPFIGSYYSDYFEQLGNSGNMEAFVHYILLSSARREEHLAWLKSHKAETDKLDAWIKNANRKL